MSTAPCAWAYPAMFVAMASKASRPGHRPHAQSLGRPARVRRGKAAESVGDLVARRSDGRYRVLVLPGAPLVTGGPYAWMRHPNYVGRLRRDCRFAADRRRAGSAGDALLAFADLMRKRIAVEERALGLGLTRIPHIRESRMPERGSSWRNVKHDETLLIACGLLLAVAALLRAARSREPAPTRRSDAARKALKLGQYRPGRRGFCGTSTDPARVALRARVDIDRGRYAEAEKLLTPAARLRPAATPRSSSDSSSCSSASALRATRTLERADRSELAQATAADLRAPRRTPSASWTVPAGRTAISARPAQSRRRMSR